MTSFQPNNALSGLFGALSANEQRKRAAWATTQPANALLGYPADAAVDELGNVICYSKYGDHESPYGWDIDHRTPSALGGSDHLSNLRALHCSHNRSAGAHLGNALADLFRKR